MNNQKTGHQISKWGVIIILLWLGVFKFTPTEARGIEPLIQNNPIFSWQLKIFSIQTVSQIIGLIEIITAIFIMLEFKFSRLAQVGYLIGVIIFLSTLSFLFTTPDTFKVVDGMLTTSWFILKDMVFLGFCLSQLNLRLLFKNK